MESLLQSFIVSVQYPVHFTTGLFRPENLVLRDTIAASGSGKHKVLVVIDDGVLEAIPGLSEQITSYCQEHRSTIHLVHAPLIVPGGEAVKNSSKHCRMIQSAISRCGICRQSFVVAIGGGAVLDAVGFAAATAHRGVRLIRVPTTVLSQDDSGVGVKNGINRFGKKNFTGSFAPPFAVINDFAFLETLSDRDWMAGVAEAVKVALIKDPQFFNYLEDHAEDLLARDMSVMARVVYRCADLHVRHIGQNGDPFENGSSRPLDFGHWAAHKLEQLTNFDLRHGEAVAIGIALDTTYSYLAGLLSRHEWNRTLSLLSAMGFALYVPALSQNLTNATDPGSLFHGLTEFREHLGGQLTVMLLRGIGRPMEVHHMDEQTLITAISFLQQSAWVKPEAAMAAAAQLPAV